MARLHLLTTLTGHEDRVWQVQWNPTQSIIASCSADKTVRLYKYKKGDNGVEFRWATTIPTGHKRTVRALAWAPSGKTLATASFDSTIGIWEELDNGDGVADQRSGEDWECISTIEGHETECKGVAFSSKGNLLATCSRDKSVWVWEVQPDFDFECLSVLMEHSQDVKCVAWHPSEEILASASYDNTIKLYLDDPSDDWYPFTTLKGHESTVWALAFSPCGHYLASCSDDTRILIWKRNGEIGDWGRVHEIMGHGMPIYTIAWRQGDPEDPDDIGWLAGGGGDGVLNVWDIK
ncbi:Cytosolic iron-sulfur protein assembly protein, partial [Tulasnella sp. JGI-2019a]